MIRLPAVEIPGHVPAEHRGRQAEHFAGGTGQVSAIGEPRPVRRAGQIIPGWVTRVKATGTNATNIVAMY